jgi:type III restriction enzyme
MRLALKLATGAGKTTVMAMLIAWQTINAVRRPQQQAFHARLPDRGPWYLTIEDRLRVLQPNDPDSYYQSRELVPSDMLAIWSAPRSSLPTTTPSSAGSDGSVQGWPPLLQGRGEALDTVETEGPDAPAGHARADGA